MIEGLDLLQRIRQIRPDVDIYLYTDIADPHCIAQSSGLISGYFFKGLEKKEEKKKKRGRKK